MGKTNRKTRKVRASPAESATSLPEGTIKAGWVTKKAANGVQRWVPEASVELNGFRKLTTDYAAKHIGKSISLYTREYNETWPAKSAWSRPPDSTHVVFQFVPDGDGLVGARRLNGWLKTQKPEVKRGTVFSISGPVLEKGKHLVDGVQVDSVGKRLLSTNFMNTEVFVRV